MESNLLAGFYHLNGSKYFQSQVAQYQDPIPHDKDTLPEDPKAASIIQNGWL